MRIEPQRSDIGRRVRYYERGTGAIKEGFVVAFNSAYVFVRFRSPTPKACRRDDLEWSHTETLVDPRITAMPMPDDFNQNMPDRLELWIGEYLVSVSMRAPGFVAITHRSGEGGTYPAADVEAAIRAFVAENF